MFAVIMAGGVGSRFWPRSREKNPKQLLSIVNDQTLIQNTVSRLEGLVPREHLFIVSNKTQKQEIRRQLPKLKPKNLIIEPKGKNTAPCIGLSALYVKRLDPEGVMAVLPADHLIDDIKRFRAVLQVGVTLATEHNSLVTIGIHPTYPATGYGYIQCNAKLKEVNGIGVYRVKTFAEKPDLEVAKRFLASGDFLWNSGIFLWKVSVILREIEEKLPELYDGLMEIEKVLGTPDVKRVAQRVYCQIRSISIDYGVMENAKGVVVIEGDFGWNDLGSWEEVYKISKKDSAENAIVGKAVLQDSQGCFVDAPGRLVAGVGLRDLIIVDTPDALLICKRERAQEVKDLVDVMKRKKWNSYL